MSSRADHATVVELLQRIVVDERPGEAAALATAIERIARDALEPGASADVGLSEVVVAIDLVSLVTATVAVFRWLREKLSRPPRADLLDRWIAELVAEGVAPEKARAIAERHASDFQEAALRVSR